MDDPTSLTATQTLGSIALAWTAPTGATSYLIERVDYDLLINPTYLAETTATSFTDYGPPRTTPALAVISYVYTVKATDGSSTSTGAFVIVDCTLLYDTVVDDVGLGHPKYKIGATPYTATLSATSYGTTVNAAAGLNDVWALHQAKSLSRL